MADVRMMHSAPIYAETKLVPSWLVGERTLRDCWVFIEVFL